MFFKIYFFDGLVAELVDALDSKSGEHLLVRVQVPPDPPKKYIFDRQHAWRASAPKSPKALARAGSSPARDTE